MAKKIGSLEGKVESVELASVQVDESYQRGDKANGRRIRDGFDQAAAGVLHVARRSDGSLWLIDGRQRRWAMMELGIRSWKAVVVGSSGAEYEAGVFSLINGRNRAALSAHDLFRAALAAHDPTAEAVVRAVESAGLRLRMHRGGSRVWPEIACVGALYRETARRGEAVVSRALGVLARTWPGQDMAMRDLLPAALFSLFAMHGDSIDDDRFVKVLSPVPPSKIHNEAAVTLSNRHNAAAAIIARLYNKGLTRQSRLKVLVEEDAA